MSAATQAIFSSWAIDPLVLLGVLAGVILYLRGWRVLRRVMPARFPAWRLGMFLAGMLALWFALASPIEPLSSLLLSAHMIQHLLLISVAPPLILLGSPLLPLLRGLPRGFAHDGLGPFLAWPKLRRFGHALTHPVVGWLAMVFSLCAWHVPLAFDLALRSPGWHKVEHACFFFASVLFWWPVVRPFPSRPHWPLWSVPLYLLATDLVNSVLCAILTFSEHSLYAGYQMVPRLFGTTALSDQVTAGVIMWVPGSVVFLVPAALVAVQYLSPSQPLVRPRRASGAGGRLLETGVFASLERRLLVALRMASPPACATVPGHGLSLNPASISAGSASLLSPTSRGHAAAQAKKPLDLLTMPIIGRFLRSLVGRRTMQVVLLLISIAVIADGLFGPQISAANLAGVVPWTWWRALTIVALLAVGNLFCMVCPFMLPRELGRRLGLKPRNWPRALRSKWLAVGLLVLFFWAYEAFGLWDKPIWTAWLIINYFLAAFVLDAFFRGASFCKYVCPIGQFQFITSLVSPLEVKVRQPDVCGSCRTHDCLRGNERHRGCETDLFLPRKTGNLDCTFCLDCVRACPHDNIGLQAVVPGKDLIHDSARSSVGRLSRRPDFAALALVLVFGAFASASIMTAPLNGWLDRLAFRAGFGSSLPVVTAFFAFALVAAPAVSVWSATRIGRAAGKVTLPGRELFCRFSLALVPLGTAMWAAHFLFHFLAGYHAAWPLFQQTLVEWGITIMGQPDWSAGGVPLAAKTIVALQTLLLDAGLLLTLYVGWRIARDCASRVKSALSLLVPWALLALALYAAGVWIFLQPMQMRGLIASSM